jgi:microcystin-dependent protein
MEVFVSTIMAWAPNFAPIGGSPDTDENGYRLGAKGGSQDVTLTTGNLPSHAHDASALTGQQAVATAAASTTLAMAAADSILGAPNFLDSGSGSKVEVNAFAAGSAAPTVSTKIQVGGATGGGQPFQILPPYLAINWIIALNGLYPSKT